jgi:hypothetical protein
LCAAALIQPIKAIKPKKPAEISAGFYNAENAEMNSIVIRLKISVRYVKRYINIKWVAAIRTIHNAMEIGNPINIPR